MWSTRALFALVSSFLLLQSFPGSAQSPPVGYWDARFGSPGSGGLGFQQSAQALAVDPVSGDVFAGGGTHLRNTGDAVLRWTGDDWAPVGGGFNNWVRAITFAPDGTLYAGGLFTTIDGSPAAHVARYAGGVWSALGEGLDGVVQTMAVDPETGALYVAGNFDNAIQTGGENVVSPDIARWNGTAWERVGFGSDGFSIASIAFDPISGDLFVGGQLGPGLRNADSTLVSIEDVGRFDGTSWSAVEDGLLNLYQVSDLAFDESGLLYVAHRFSGGFARWDRSEWSVPAGGLGYTDTTFGPNGDDGMSLAIGVDRVYIGGSFTVATQPDGTPVTARGITAYDPVTDRFETLGEGVHRASTASHLVDAIVVRPLGEDGEELFLAGTFGEAGARPSTNIARWTSAAPFDAAEVTFRADLRSAMRLGLFANLRYLYPATHRPMVDVFTGEGADRYLLFDSDGDSIWTARVALPKNSTVNYAFAQDFSGSGFERDTDWTYELGAPEGTVRTAILSAAARQTQPVFSFDGFPAVVEDLDFVWEMDRRFASGNPVRQRYPYSSATAVVFVDPEYLDRPMNVAVRLYQKDPGGAPPAGVVGIAETAYWSMVQFPQTAQYSASVEFDWGEIPGVAEPADLRLLHREDPYSPWQIVAADVNANDLTITTVDVTRLVGEWTIGSVSITNPLSTDPPEVVHTPSPDDGVFAAPLKPLFRWDGGFGASEFDLYLWPSGEAEPPGPSRSNIQKFQVQQLVDLVFGETYNWRIVARNVNGETPGPVWSFTVGQVPDLVLNSVDLPPSGFSGGEVVVDWTVTNLGDEGTNVAVWYDEVFVSDEAVFDSQTATKIGRTRNLSYLGPGDSYANSMAVAIPDGIDGAKYIHVVTDVDHGMDESDEANNWFAAPVEIVLAPYADLEVTSVTAPSNVFSGDSVAVTVMVENKGNGRTSATDWFDSVFLSNDDVFDYNFTGNESLIRIRELFLARNERLGALEAGESYEWTRMVSLPDSAAGSYTIFVATDLAGADKQPVSGEVYEFNQELDNWTGRSLSITLTPPPDLVVTSVEGPANINSGEIADLSWVVENQGPGGTRESAWKDLIYFAQQASFDPSSATILGAFGHNGVLFPDESYYAGGRVRIPDGIDGDGYFFAVADYQNRVFEFTFEDNNRSGSTIPSVVQRSPYPDLQIVAAAASTSSATAGEQIALTYTVENTGDLSTQGGWTDTVYLLPDPVFDPGLALEVLRVAQESVLAPGTSRTRTVAVTIPTTVDGIVYPFVVSDAADDLFEYPDENGNAATSGPIEVAASPPSDLLATFETPPTDAMTGQALETHLVVSNPGEGPTVTDKWLDRVYLSSDDLLDPEADLLIAVREHLGDLIPGESYSFGSVLLPQNLVGTYYLIAQIDAGQDETEVDETNNVASAEIVIDLTPPADLRITGIDSASEIESGHSVLISWTVANEGSGPTRSTASNHNWFDAVFLSSDGQLDGDDSLLGIREHTDSLQAGAEYMAQLEVAIPPYASGRYVLLVKTDQREDVHEYLAEGNNTAAFPVDITLPAPSDLVVSSISAPTTASAGEALSVTWTILNQGPNPARGIVRDAIFLSADSTWDIADAAFGIVDREIDLAPGTQSSAALKVDPALGFMLGSDGSITETVPGLLPGLYHVIVRTDIRNVIRETDEENNHGIAESTLATSVQILAYDSPTEITLSAGEMRYFLLEDGGDRDVRVSVASGDGTGAFELYIAAGRVPTPGGDFDYAAAKPFSAEQSTIFEALGGMSHYLAVVAREASPVPVSVLAEQLDLGITDVVPAVGGQGQVTIAIHGAGFNSPSRITLRNASGTEYDGVQIGPPTSTELTVRWRLDQVAIGDYDLVVENGDGAAATRVDGFRVEPAERLVVDADILAPEAIRNGGAATYTLNFTNRGNTDIPYLVIEAASSFADHVDVETSEGLLSLRDMVPEPFNPYGLDYVYSDTSIGSVPMLQHDLPPGAVATAKLTFRNPVDPLLLSLYSIPLDATQYVARLDGHLGIARDFMLRHSDIVDPFFVQIAADPEEFRWRYFTVFSALGLLDESDSPFPRGGAATSMKRSAFAEGDDSDDGCLIFYQDGSVAQVWPCPPDPPPTPPDPPLPPLPPAPPPGGPGAGGGSPPMDPCGSFDRCLDQKARQCGYAGALHCAALGGTLGLLSFGAGGLATGALCSLMYVDACDADNPNSLPQSICRPVKNSCDPNDILGPDGYGDERWVMQDQTLGYTIRFENDPIRASTSAQVVDVTHPLDPNVDLRTFRLDQFGFGPFRFDPPQNVSYYRTRLDVVDSLGVMVDVTAGVDVTGSRAFWIFRTVDPLTGDQPINDPFAGFLPVNDDSGAGQGFASYTIGTAADVKTGNQVRARADIVFDLNPPLETPGIFNTVDASPPISSVAVQPGRQDTTAFHVSWSGTDEGSGIRDYELYVSTDGGPFGMYQSATGNTSLLFIAEIGHTYRFFSIATDNVGNREPMKTEGEAVTVVAIEGEVEPGLPSEFALHQNYPNPFNPTTTVPFDIAEHGEVQIAVYNVLGQRVLVARQETMSPGHYQQTVDMSRFASGVYFYVLSAAVQGGTRFQDVRKFVLVK